MAGKLTKKSAESYIGKHILIGLNYIDQAGKVIERQQIHGYFVRINEKEGIVVRLYNSEEEINLPPDFSGFDKAPVGVYHLEPMGEIIHNPDFLATWTLKDSPPEENK